jgi:hypothetical protein
MVVLTVLFGPSGLIKHGKNVEIQQGQALHAFVSDDIRAASLSSGSVGSTRANWLRSSRQP